MSLRERTAFVRLLANTANMANTANAANAGTDTARNNVRVTRQTNSGRNVKFEDRREER